MGRYVQEVVLRVHEGREMILGGVVFRRDIWAVGVSHGEVGERRAQRWRRRGTCGANNGLRGAAEAVYGDVVQTPCARLVNDTRFIQYEWR